jgi:hypothetical protein
MAERIVFPHTYRAIDPAVRREIVDHAASDGWPLTGILYRPPSRDPDVVVLAMHPRADFSRHYLAPQLTAAGYAFMGATSRYLNHDADALHERLVVESRNDRPFRAAGFRKVILREPCAARSRSTCSRRRARRRSGSRARAGRSSRSTRPTFPWPTGSSSSRRIRARASSCSTGSIRR